MVKILGRTPRVKHHGIYRRKGGIHLRGQPRGDAQNKLHTAFFIAAIENYGIK